MNIIHVTAGVIECEGRILIAKRKREGHLPCRWGFPRAKVERGESPKECLIRQMMEEFSVKIEVGEFVGRNTHDYGGDAICLWAFKCVWEEGNFNSDVQNNIRWIRLNQLKNFKFSPEERPIVKKLIMSFGDEIPCWVDCRTR